MPALPGDAPRKRRRRSRSRLNNRRHSLREGLESREAWQPLNPAGHRLIKKLQSSLTAKECGKHVIGFLLRFWSLAHRGPELADAESRQAARKFGLAQLQPCDAPVEVLVDRLFLHNPCQQLL